MREREVVALVILGVLMLRKREDAKLAGAWTWPVPSWNGILPIVSSGFNDARQNRRHDAADILYRVRGRYVAPAGTPILAANAGRVTNAQRTARGGWVFVRHQGNVDTSYLHLESIDVAPGSIVQAGQRIGTMGVDPLDAGGVRHLHFEVWRRDGTPERIDPQSVGIQDWRVEPWTTP